MDTPNSHPSPSEVKIFIKVVYLGSPLSHILAYLVNVFTHDFTLSPTGIKYHTTTVENIKAITHDTKMFTLKLPKGSYLNVPTGHHLAIKADIAGA